VSCASKLLSYYDYSRSLLCSKFSRGSGLLIAECLVVKAASKWSSLFTVSSEVLEIWIY
jgi:hypothetical protein